MRVLFVCRANVGRSQMAQDLFNKLSKEKSSSAGILVDSEGETIEEFAKKKPHAQNVIICMREEGINSSKNLRTQLTEKMIREFDKIVVIAAKELWPDYLKKSNKVIFWDVEDAAGTDLEFHRKTRDEIKKQVLKFIKEIKAT